MIPLMPILGTFLTAGGVKLDEDDHGSVSTVSGVLTLSEEGKGLTALFQSVLFAFILSQ